MLLFIFPAGGTSIEERQREEGGWDTHTGLGASSYPFFLLLILTNYRIKITMEQVSSHNS